MVITLLQAANTPQPYYAGLAPSQWYHLAATIAPGMTITNMPAIQNAIAGRFFVGNCSWA